MTWLQRYRIRHYLANSIWVWPVIAMIAGVEVVRLLELIEELAGWTSKVEVDTARTMLSTMASTMFTFIVFVSSALLVAVQLASAQLTPRIIGIVFKDRVTRGALTLFVFTFTLTLAALIRVNSAVPPITTRVAAYSSLLSLGAFLYLIDHVGKALRPSGALREVGRVGCKVVESVYPQRADTPQAAQQEAAWVANGPPTRIVPSLGDGAVLAFDVRGLATLAERADCVIEMVPQVGDFIAAGDPLFRVFRGGETLAPEALQNSVAVGFERTVEQDPTFALRIMVDIANKGLSPAINDPTTAVLALDQIHRLLRSVGGRRLDDGRIRDAAGKLRLVYRTPDWEEFVHLAVTEIRQFGGVSIQIARRLKAMLEDLIRTLPEERAPRLREELAVLHRSAERFFSDPADRALADVSDLQGVGGKGEARPSCPSIK
jgi:uncharacterized membrane protein